MERCLSPAAPEGSDPTLTESLVFISSKHFGTTKSEARLVWVFVPTGMPSFMSLLSFPGLVAVNFDPCMFEQCYLTALFQTQVGFPKPPANGLCAQHSQENAFHVAVFFSFLFGAEKKKKGNTKQVGKVARTVKLMGKRKADLRFLVNVRLP